MITVFGGAGFIGSHVVDELMAQGHEVLAFDNLSEGRMENLALWKDHKRFTFMKGDIRDYSDVRRAVDGSSIVFNFAAMSRIQPSITDPLGAFTQNYVGTANIAEACREAGTKRLVYAGSSSAYGRKNDHQIGRKPVDPSPTCNGGLTEDLPTDCLNPYSLSKRGAEEILDLYQKLYGLSTITLRYFNVYGPRHQEEGSYATVIAIWRKQLRQGRPLTIVGDGNQRRDFTFVGDVVRANMLAMMDWNSHGIYNVGSGRNYSINELAGIVAPGHPTVNLPPRLGEAHVTLADYTKIYETLGWEPQVQIREGLQIIDEYEKRFGNQSGLVVVTR